MATGTTKATRPKVGIIIGSTRPGRHGEAVAKWVYEIARKRKDAEFELVDLKDHPLPLLDEPIPASAGQYAQGHTRTWAAKIASLDAFVFVTPEYNHSTSGVLKNAIDYLYAEWNNKAAGFVSYGSAGGVRAVEHLRLVMAEVQVATVRAQAALYLATDFENYRTFRPDPAREQAVLTMLDQLIAWGNALRSLRAATPSTA
jgi:NAD(P)H-dependent FMN reductase